MNQRESWIVLILFGAETVQVDANAHQRSTMSPGAALNARTRAVKC